MVGLEDYLPVFLSTEHSVQVPEDAQRGTEVLRLATLTRPGAEKTGYRVVSGNEQGRFRLDARTGETAPGGSSTPTLNTRACAHTHTHTLPHSRGAHWILYIPQPLPGIFQPLFHSGSL